MLVVTVMIRYKGKNGSAKEFVNAMISSGLVKTIREEAGNLRYEYFLSLEEDDSVVLIDSWENQEALDHHHQLPLMKEIAHLRERFDLHMEVEKYQLLDDESDERFIRR